MRKHPVILAVDTTSEFGSVALRRGDEPAGQIELHSPDGFAHVVFPAIGDLLRQCETQIKEVDCFAAASGPGSFTGVRVGLAAVKGLAAALAKPAVGVSTLRALSVFGSAPLRAVVMDARRGDIYGAVYDAQARIVVGEVVSSWAIWRTAVPGGAEFVGWSEGPCQALGTFTAAPRWLAGAVAQCAGMESSWADPTGLDANYVRRSDAELFWKERE